LIKAGVVSIEATLFVYTDYSITFTSNSKSNFAHRRDPNEFRGTLNATTPDHGGSPCIQTQMPGNRMDKNAAGAAHLIE
jgi:hypothetical protein